MDRQTSPISPLFTSPVSAGFPSPADDFLERNLDLNNYLIRHPTATFFVRVQGDSMIQSGIRSGDILIVDRALEKTNNQIVIALINGEFTVKKIQKIGQKLYLMPANPKYRPILITQEMSFEIWGTVTYVIHPMNNE
ncbi:MAG: translesion error-prone DNA polymerase V autoproteolytic subunit [Candidatus Gracilibacteria bacterium]